MDDGSPGEPTGGLRRPEIVDQGEWVDRSDRIPWAFPRDVVGDSVRKRFVMVTLSVLKDKTTQVLATHPVHEEVVGGGRLGSPQESSQSIKFGLVEVIVMSKCVEKRDVRIVVLRQRARDGKGGMEEKTKGGVHRSKKNGSQVWLAFFFF